MASEQREVAPEPETVTFPGGFLNRPGQLIAKAVERLRQHGVVLVPHRQRKHFRNVHHAARGADVVTVPILRVKPRRAIAAAAERARARGQARKKVGAPSLPVAGEDQVRRQVLERKTPVLVHDVAE